MRHTCTSTSPRWPCPAQGLRRAWREMPSLPGCCDPPSFPPALAPTSAHRQVPPQMQATPGSPRPQPREQSPNAAVAAAASSFTSCCCFPLLSSSKARTDDLTPVSGPPRPPHTCATSHTLTSFLPAHRCPSALKPLRKSPSSGKWPLVSPRPRCMPSGPLSQPHRFPCSAHLPRSARPTPSSASVRGASDASGAPSGLVKAPSGRPGHAVHTEGAGGCRGPAWVNPGKGQTRQAQPLSSGTFQEESGKLRPAQVCSPAWGEA